MCRQLSFAALVLLTAVLANPGVRADQAADEAAIRKAVESYNAAFNQRDAKALAAHWLPDAVYTDPDTGAKVVGRAAIEKYFAKIFAKAKNLKLVVHVDSIRFVSPHVAIEHGTASVLGQDKVPTKTRYSAVHVNRDGKWLLDRVSEEDEPVVISNYEKLKDLEWMVGAWVDDDENATVETSVKWSKNQNFLVRTFSVTIRDRIDSSGIQIIGWDPAAKQIRSWVFDSDGAFGEAVWNKKGNRWNIQAKETLANGLKASSMNVITVLNKNSFTWQSIDRQAGGAVLPNVQEVVLVRQPEVK